MNCNSCASNSYSFMNNGTQQPMPQVRTLPSNNLTNSMNNTPNPPMNPPSNETINVSKDAVQKAVIDAVSKNNNLENTTNTIIKKELTDDIEISTNVLVRSLAAALTFIVALGWNEAIKYYVSRYIKFHQGSQHSLLIYALCVTLLLVIFVRIFKTKLEKNKTPYIKI